MVDDVIIITMHLQVISNISIASDFHKHLYSLSWLPSYGKG